MASDVLVLLEKRPRLAVTLLSDGAHEMVDLLATEVATRLGVDSVQLVDFWHLVEKLAPAAQVISADEASALLARWKLRMLNTEYAAVDILGELAASGLEHRRVGNTQPVH
ncbi:MAG TPA: ISKra4 family transposase, partial [Thermoleophilia bacterium]|nr:ISKra4 family transposase [Thermoleophilia bacterium]